MHIIMRVGSSRVMPYEEDLKMEAGSIESLHVTVHIRSYLREQSSACPTRGSRCYSEVQRAKHACTSRDIR